LQASDGSSGTPYQVGYDTAGRANSYTDQQGRNTQVQYDGVGNRTRLQWPAGTNGAGAYFVTYQYDAMNRMTNILDNGSSLLAHYTWDSLSRQTSISDGDGTTDAYSQYDAGDNLQTLTQSFAGGSGVTFSYGWQKNHQRATTSVSNGAFAFVPFTGTTTYGTPDPNNGYTSANAGSGNVAFTYDTNRNLTYDGSNTLTYDVENRLVGASNLITASQYLYDPLGNRKQKQVQMGGGDVVTQFLAPGGEEIADYNCYGSTCAPWVLTVRGPGGLPVAAITPASGSQAETVVYYHHDVMGSTVASTVPGLGGAAEAYAYSDFGAPAGGSYLAQTFAIALRELLALPAPPIPGLTYPLQGPSGPEATPATDTAAFDASESAWQAYAKAECSAAGVHWRGGTIVNQIIGQCNLRQSRARLHELVAVYGDNLQLP
jgi:YD repeat-containing protein